MHLVPLTVLALGILVSHGTAQTDSSAKTTRVLVHTFTRPGREFVRIRLESTQTYQVQINRARVKLEVRPVSPGVAGPSVREIAAGQNLHVFALQPRVTTEYEIRVIGEGDRPIRIMVDRTVVKPLNQ